MTAWIKERATQIRRAENEKKTERERQIAAANELKAKTGPYWGELLRVLDASVKEFNMEFPEPERRIDLFDPTAVAVTIRRTAYPTATVKANLNTQGTSIQYSISLTVRKGASPVEKQANLAVGIVGGEARYLDTGCSTHDEVAKLLLDPFFEF